MNFRLLQYFLAVASSLSFSRAADNLHIAQSTLSQQIQRLEEHYGVQLFVRSGRTVTLTAAGLALQEAASHLLVEEDQLAVRLKEIAKGNGIRHCPLRIFFDMHMTRAPYLVNDLIESIHEIQIETKGRFSFHASFQTSDMDAQDADVQGLLNNSQIDFWVLGSETRLQHGDVRLEVIADDQFAFTISKYHPLYREDLTAADLPRLVDSSTLFLLQNRSRYISYVLDSVSAEGCSPNIHFEKNAEVNSFYVSLGMGLSIMPENTKDSVFLSQAKVVPLPDTHFYTLAGYRRDSDNPLLPMLLERFRQKSALHAQPPR